MELLSPAQCVGYLAFFLGVGTFLQKSDRSLKVFNAGACLVYAVHFVMLGNLPASGSALVSSVRSFLALRTRAPWLAGTIIAINLVVGVTFAKSGAGWLPVIASCSATIAIFYMQGIPMRLVLLGCTFLWLINNILSGSIGGTLLETVLAIVNTTTIFRMVRPLTPEPVAVAQYPSSSSRTFPAKFR
ncbi:MAG TPA: YgjV family protein [Bryobacteraceae bacterium]|nr:YgjV family protein [Bryobacteraceae bacterium]